MPYSVVDLFAGAGGLSLGFMQTEKFDIKVAFERERTMQETYHKNHPNVEIQGDVCEADYDDIQRRYGLIDVVIGGPPCQGFSNANRQKNHVISQNNMLVRQYIRAITELRPKAFIMENVGMLKSSVHRFYMSENDVDVVKKYNIPNRNTELHLLEKTFIFEGALDIVQDLEQIEENLWPEDEYYFLNIVYKRANNIAKMEKSLAKHREKLIAAAKRHLEVDANNYISNVSRTAFNAILNYDNGLVAPEEIEALIEPAIMIQRMLSKAKEIFDNNIHVENYELLEEEGIIANVRSFAVFDYMKDILTSNDYGYKINSKVICAADYGAPQKRYRFIVMGVRGDIASTIEFPKPIFDENSYRTVHDAISDLENVPTVFDLSEDREGIKLNNDDCDSLHPLARSLRNSKNLKNHIVTKTTEVAMERFKSLKEGQNFHDLEENLKTNTYTDVKRTQNTVYLRLKYSEPSGTVLNVRKSMWIHPKLNRAISVREAARLQTFPDSFVFCGTKDKQYQQVGNAVPPILANTLAEKIADMLDEKSKG